MTDLPDFIPCTPKSLERHQWCDAADIACSLNPCNRPAFADFDIEPDYLAAMTTKYWKTEGVKLSVSFMDSPPAGVRNRILAHMNAWGQWGNVKFMETGGTGQVRIARTPRSGYWSFLGTDILSIPTSQPTMNLDSFTDQTPESEYVRVVRHETGHTLGFPHEHMRQELIALLDREKTIAYFMRTQGWSQRTVIQQVLTPLSESSLIATPHADGTSIMTYQLPGEITINGQPIPGGSDIDQQDREFVAKLYPLAVVPSPPPPPPPPPVDGKPTGMALFDGNGKLLKRYAINEVP